MEINPKEAQNQLDIIRGEVMRVINGETFDMRIDVFNPDNQRTYASIERVFITDLHSPKLYQRWGFHIRKLLRKSIGGKEVRIEVLQRNAKGQLETTWDRLSTVVYSS